MAIVCTIRMSACFCGFRLNPITGDYRGFARYWSPQCQRPVRRGTLNQFTWIASLPCVCSAGRAEALPALARSCRCAGSGRARSRPRAAHRAGVGQGGFDPENGELIAGGRRVRLAPLPLPAAGISSARAGRVSGGRVAGSRLRSLLGLRRRPTRRRRVTLRAARRRPRGPGPRLP
jgi:hypothetical protein